MAVRDVVQAAAGVGGGGEYIEDVFSTYLYTGNGSTQTITNGIDLAGEGGLVWTKHRAVGVAHALFDTERGGQYRLTSNDTSAPGDQGSSVVTFNSNGYTWTAVNSAWNNNLYATNTYVGWTFRKSPKFFDIVTYTGNGASNRQISHSLGSTPGMLTTKRTDAAGSWNVQHRSMAGGDGTATDWERRLLLESTTSSANTGLLAPTSEVFYATDGYNLNGATYVAYLFAHNAGGFGDDGLQNVISCGSFVTNANNGTFPDVTLGFEPQWILWKSATTGNAWFVADTMRGWDVSGNSQQLSPNNANQESADTAFARPTATGFTGGSGAYGATYIYIAIRRGPMKTPESGTEVFDPDYNASFPQPGVVTTGFVTDWNIYKRTGGGSTIGGTRLTGGNYLFPDATDAESAGSSFLWDNNTGLTVQSLAGSGNATINWAFRRAPSVFDVVCYTGTGVAHTEAHNLGVVPEMMIVKKRSNAADWKVYASGMGNTATVVLNTTAALDAHISYWNNTSPTASVFTVGTNSDLNQSTHTFVAYLFATLPGVSKVGSYTGTGADLNVDCGFSAGARFILIKRTDSTGDWYVWDSARGIVSGNDPYLLLNSTAAQVTNTDYIDPLASGFTVTSTAPAALNASGGSYIFLAIA